jgi:predicted ferric reductase
MDNATASATNMTAPPGDMGLPMNNTAAASNGTQTDFHSADYYQNIDMVKYICWTWFAIIGSLFLFRWTLHLLHHVRRMANLNTSVVDGRQRYFSMPNDKFAKFKRHFLYAPLLRKRHNQEFRLSSAVNVGTLPGRLQTCFLFGYLALNIAFCAWKVDYHDGAWVWVGVRRMGVLSVINMVPLFLLAGRNNPLIPLLGITFDTYNLIHRWIGRISVLEAFIHVAFWVYGKTRQDGADMGWKEIVKAMANRTMTTTGTIGMAAFILLLFHSPSIIRHAFYEVFLGIHLFLAFVAVVTVWMHLDQYGFSQKILGGAIVCWGFERLMRMYLLIRANYSRAKGVTKADVEALPGDALRVTLRVARPWKFRPGQHLYLYMPSIGLFSSHPFSIVWSEEITPPLEDKPLPIARTDILAAKETSMSLIIRRRTGFTDSLWRKAAGKGPFTASALVEGPYGNECFQSYGTVMLFAAGVGITHQVPHVRDLVAAYANGTCATRKVILVWVIQSPEHLEWIRPWMTQVLAMERRRDILKILLFVTRPRSTKEIHSPSASVQMYPGKPDVRALITREQEKQVGAMAISVCGTGSLADDVRRAMRERCEVTELDFYEEAFSW